MEKRQDRISHMHIHDAIGEKNHLQLFTGEMDLDRFVNMIIIKDMTAVIETKTKLSLEKSVLSLNKMNKISLNFKSKYE